MLLPLLWPLGVAIVCSTVYGMGCGMMPGEDEFADFQIFVSETAKAHGGAMSLYNTERGGNAEILLKQSRTKAVDRSVNAGRVRFFQNKPLVTQASDRYNLKFLPTVKFAAEPADVGFDGCLVTVRVKTPDFLQKLILGKDNGGRRGA